MKSVQPRRPGSQYAHNSTRRATQVREWAVTVKWSMIILLCCPLLMMVLLCSSITMITTKVVCQHDHGRRSHCLSWDRVETLKFLFDHDQLIPLLSFGLRCLQMFHGVKISCFKTMKGKKIEAMNQIFQNACKLEN